MVHPFWSFDNDTATAVTDSIAEIDIARQLNAEKDREIERLSRQLEAQKKTQMHSNTQRRTSPILWRLYLASLQNLTLRIKQSPVRKHRLPPSCRKNLWYRYPQRNRRGLVRMILVRTMNAQKGVLVRFQTLSLQLLDESRPTHGLPQTELKSWIFKRDWDSRTNELTMISGYIV